MTAYIIRRSLLALPTLLAMTLVVFAIMHLSVDTDAVDLLVAEYGNSDPELAAHIRDDFGLDKPLWRQYLDWIAGIAQGDLGQPFYSSNSVSHQIIARLPVSVELGALALVISVVLAIPLGMVSAVRRDSAIDYVTRGTAILLYAVPGFWIATLVLVYGSRWFGWAPHLGYSELWEDPRGNLGQILVPALLMALLPLGVLLRIVRTQALEVLGQDYVRTARAKGIREKQVLGTHVLRNALIPVVTVIGLQVPRMFAGTVVFEQIFSLPGMGTLLIESVTRLDYPMILGINLIVGSVVILANLATDIAYAIIDPRITYA